MPRPPKKKAKKNPHKDDEFTGKKGKHPALQTDSSDDLKNLASLIKCPLCFLLNDDFLYDQVLRYTWHFLTSVLLPLDNWDVLAKRASKAGNPSFENFERKCFKLLEDTTRQIESKIETHEANLDRLYRSVEQINEELEPTESEVVLERILNKTFDNEVGEAVLAIPLLTINHLSRALTDMNSEKSCDGDELQIDSGILEELTMRPEQLAEFSRRMTHECKRGFRMYCENNQLASDSRRFKEKYRALMKEVL